jgi:hypothetical protein
LNVEKKEIAWMIICSFNHLSGLSDEVTLKILNPMSRSIEAKHNNLKKVKLDIINAINKVGLTSIHAVCHLNGGNRIARVDYIGFKRNEIVL